MPQQVIQSQLHQQGFQATGTSQQQTQPQQQPYQSVIQNQAQPIPNVAHHQTQSMPQQQQQHQQLALSLPPPPQQQHQHVHQQPLNSAFDTFDSIKSAPTAPMQQSLANRYTNNIGYTIASNFSAGNCSFSI